ncbi:MAG: glycosyltransferase family 2 protein [Prolixibacteraceae bacterium]|nr:glycosyltransferase family 2 protein [Prolixibacteraceae bacterium]
MIKATVIIVTYNASKWIEKCFGSLQQSTIPVNVIAIDNGSTDGTPDIIRSKFPTLEVIENNENLGFGKANNIGIRKAYDASADYVFLLNQDAWVEKDTIEILVKTAEDNPDYGIISPVHLNGSGTNLDYGFLNYINRNQDKSFIFDILVKKSLGLNQIYSLDFINAAFWLLPRKTIETVGGFNPFFFQYGEDRDYVNRCHYYNLKIGFAPEAFAYHDRQQFDSESKKNLLKRNETLLSLFNPTNDNRIGNLISEMRKNRYKKLLKGEFKLYKSIKKDLHYFKTNESRIEGICNELKLPGLSFI